MTTNLIRRKSNSALTIKYVCLIVFSIVLFYPVYWLLLNSLVQKNTPSVVFMAKSFHFDNYVLAFTMAPYLKYVLNSCIFLAIAMGMNLIINPLMGYAFARLEAPGKKIIFSILLATMMIPVVTIQIPQYVFFAKDLNLSGSYWVYVFMNIAGSAYLVFLIRQFFITIPKEMDDSAKIDGCSVFGIIIRIYLPISVPIIAVCTFFLFTAVWQDYLTSFFYFSTPQYSIATSLWGSMFYYNPNSIADFYFPVYIAACVVFAIPPVVAFFVTQKYLIQGIATTGLKG